MTRIVASAAYASSPIAGRFTMTFSAAPRAAASPSIAATFRSLDALTLLRPTSASASDDELDARLDGRHRDVGGRPRGLLAAPPCAPHAPRPCRGAASSPRRTPAYAAASSSARSRNRAARARPPLDRPDVQRLVSGVLRPALRERRDHRDERRAEGGRDGGRAAATGNGLGRGEPVDERGEGQVAEAPARRGIVWHPAIVGCDPVANAPPLRSGSTARGGRVGTGADAVPARPPRGPTTASGRRSPGEGWVRRRDDPRRGR